MPSDQSSPDSVATGSGPARPASAFDPGRSAPDLLAAARSAAAHADAPYSHFPVGAAVEAVDGRIFPGCNIESASYGLTICAERVAIFSAIAAGAVPRRISVACLAGDPTSPTSLTPCGACRQIMLDKMGPDGEVLIDGVGTFTVDQLLPLGFRLG